MATYPTYNPSDFVNGISTEEYQTLTGSGSDNNPLINRATQGQYAPGSTFKLVTATAALQHGLITGSTPFDDTGGFHTPNCVGSACFKRNSGGEVLGELSLPGALTRSSDAFFYKLGFQFYTQSNVYGPSALHDTAVSYGLAQPTGIPTGNEAVGFIPDAATEAERHKEAPAAFNGQWLPGDAENAAVGQGDVLVTPLQLANAYATFANHGTRYQPQVVQAILKPGGVPNKPSDVLTVVKPVVAGHVDLTPAMYAPMLSGLQGVLSNPRGTAYQAFAGFNLQAVPLAGKTGTAEVSGKADTSLFASFGPVGSPQYAIVAVLEQSGFGADAAAPGGPPRLGDGHRPVPDPGAPAVHRDHRLMALTANRGASSFGGGRDRSRRDLSAPWRHVDPVLLVCTVFISLLGIVTVFSATRGNAGPPNHSYLIKQTLFVVLGFGAMVVTASIDYRKYRDWLVPIYAFMVLFLALVVSPLGSNANGAQSWYGFGGFQLQPSEISKVLLIMTAGRPAGRLEGRHRPAPADRWPWWWPGSPWA